MFCVKTLTKVPMAAVGLLDLVGCAVDKTVCSLAKRGEKAVKKMEKKVGKMKDCCCEDPVAAEQP